MDRACLLAGALLVAAAAAWGAPGDAVPGIGNGRIRVEAKIPGYLKLSLQSEGTQLAEVDPMGLRQIAVRAEANTPWALLATLRGGTSETQCILRQSGQPGWLPLASGRTMTIPCEVVHFAGTHDINIEWQVVPGTADDVRLDLELVAEGLPADPLFKAPREVQVAWAPPAAPPAHTAIPLSEYTPAVVLR